MSLITKVSLFVEPLPTFFLGEDAFMSVVDVNPPNTLIEEADEAMDLCGELISYINGNPFVALEKIRLMVDEERKGFFDKKSVSTQWATFFASTPTGLRYSVLVEFDAAELAYRNFQNNTGSDLKRWIRVKNANTENEQIFHETEGKRQEASQDSNPSTEIEELVERASSTISYSYEAENAWTELEKLPGREAAVEPLMRAFHRHSGINGSTLCKFLGNLGSESSRKPLFEILDYARRSSDEWDQKYLLGSACANLLKLPGGVTTLRSTVSSDLFGFIIVRALMIAKDEERTQVVESLTEDERQDAIIELISFFRSVEDKGEWVREVSYALSSLGDKAIESLLEIFRAVKQSIIEDDGSVEIKGEDGSPASAIVRIPGGIEKLRSVCPPDEYESILVRAHDYGDSSNPNLNRALGDIATPKAIARLRFVLQQNDWGAESRKPAKEALVKAGKKAHTELLRCLVWRAPTDLKFQTSLRKEILDVLKETGDEDCVLSIRTLMADPLIAEESRATIEAISRRCSDVEVPDTIQSKPLPFRSIARTGDEYVDSCFQIEFQEFYDERDWFEMPEAKAIPRAETTEEALRLAEALREKYPDFDFSYYWFNILYRRQGRYDDARKIIIEGLRTAKSKSSLCERMGETEWQAGNLPEAVQWWIKSIVIQTGTDNLDDYVPFLNLSHVAEQTCLFDASMRLRKYVDSIRPGQIRVTDEIANEFYTATRNQGTESMRRAINLLNTAYLKSIRHHLDVYLSVVTQSFSTSPEEVRSALSLVLRHKAAEAEAEAKALAAQHEVVLTGKYPEVELKLREIAALRAKIAQKNLASAGKEGVQAHRLFLAKWHAQKEQLEVEVARQVRELDVQRKLRSIDHQVVAMSIPVGATLVEFVRFDVFDFKAVGEPQWKPARYLAFVIPAGEPEAVEMIDLGEAEPIDRMIATFRSIITGEAEDRNRGLGAVSFSVQRATGKDVGIELRDAVFTPLLKAIANRKRLMISPDGDLTRLPFEILPADDGRRLIDEYQISYLGAGRDVVRFDFKSNRKPARSLVVADPDFDFGAKVIHSETTTGAGRRSRDLKHDEMHFDRLPGTKVEGETIAAILDAELWLESAALDARLKQCQSPRILHLATHGFFLEDQKRDPNEDRQGHGAMIFSETGMGRLTGSHLENPLLRSGLALAGVNTWLEKGELMEEAEDGLLTAEDVSGLDLLDTELVVLSACETGLGEVRVGEGVFGLRRAFVLAGAKTLVMSLWKVPDDETQELMEDFYRRILAGQPRADALREAQLAMKAKHPEPKYWGAFICQGYDGPLSN